MQLSNRQLTAFMTVAFTLNFTRASERLGITQSALSQRIRLLEQSFGTVLLNRSTRGVELTEAGRQVLRFCRTCAILEDEILSELAEDPQGELKGVVRVAAHSSILRPVLIPVLAPMIEANPLIQLELINAEAKDLPGILKRGETDFMIMDRALEGANLETFPLGDEVYIAVTGAHLPEGHCRDEVYLDLDAKDRVTEEFFQKQKNPPRYRRSFLSDVFGIIDGVENGLGRAVVSRHLIKDNPNIRVLDDYQPVSSPVTLHHHAHAHYSNLHLATRDLLCAEFAKYLL